MIERIFGVMKRRFKVLTIPQEYGLWTQAQIMCTLAVVHNFMKINDPNNPLLKDKTLGRDSELDDNITTWHAGTQEERVRAAVRREEIALAMWEDYQSKRGHA